jgi:hypothetical protein
MGYMKQLDIIDKQIKRFADELEGIINDLSEINPGQYALGETISRLRELVKDMRAYPVL